MSLNIDETSSLEWNNLDWDEPSGDDDALAGPDDVIAGTGRAFAADGTPGGRTGHMLAADDESGWGLDTGATTAEYAITTLAACGFAALLVVILKSDPIRDVVTSIITAALGMGS